MKTKQEQQEQKLSAHRDSRENYENYEDGENYETGITVDVQKLSRGLKTTFEGVAMVFDSLGKRLDVAEFNTTSAKLMESEENPTNKKPQNISEAVPETPSELAETVKTADVKEVNTSETPAEIPAESEHADEPKEDQTEAQQSDTVDTVDTADTEQPEETKSSITRDDIVRLVTKKLKENRDINGPKIRKIINQHNAENLPQLTEENFEAVMTEIASL